MSKFNKLDLQGPATLQATLEAIVRLGAFDEAQVLEFASAGKLKELFPFHPASPKDPIADFMSEGDLTEASPLPLSVRQRATLIQSSMPTVRNNVRSRQTDPANETSSFEQLAAFMTTDQASRAD
jgi:hypothetical protein